MGYVAYIDDDGPVNRSLCYGTVYCSAVCRKGKSWRVPHRSSIPGPRYDLLASSTSVASCVALYNNDDIYTDHCQFIVFGKENERRLLKGQCLLEAAALSNFICLQAARGTVFSGRPAVRPSTAISRSAISLYLVEGF